METRIGLEKTVYKKFLTKYKFEPVELDIIQAENIIFNEKCHLVSLFKDYLIIYDENEFLKRYYTITESPIRLKKYIAYYETFNFIYPNYTAIPESKFIYHNIHKKQRILDEQEQIERENLAKINNSSISNINETVFDSSAYNSILQPSANLYNSVFGIDEDKDEDSIDEIKKLIYSISNTNVLNNSYLQKILIKHQKKYPICIKMHYAKNKDIKKPDSSPITPIPKNKPLSSKNALKTIPNKNLKLQNFEDLYTKIIDKPKYIKKSVGKKEKEIELDIDNDSKKKYIINNGKKNSYSNITKQLIYCKLNPVYKVKQVNYFSVNSSRVKSKLTGENTDSESSSQYNKIINSNSNFFIKKINSIKANERYNENSNKNTIPGNNSITNGRLIGLAEVLKSFKHKNLIYQKNKSENKTESKKDYRLIRKKLMPTRSQLCQSLSNNNGKKNSLFKELELFNMKKKKKCTKLAPIRINKSFHFEIKKDISCVMRKKKAIATESNKKHMKNINFNNNHYFSDLYPKINFISSPCNQFSARKINNNYNTPSKSPKFITSNKYNKYLNSERYVTPPVQNKINKVLMIKKIPIPKSGTIGRSSKVKSVNSVNTNNKNSVIFRKSLVGRNCFDLSQNKTNYINKNYLSVNFSNEKRNSNDFHNNNTYLGTEYRSLNNYYKNMISNSKINKNTINFINNNIINFNNNSDINKNYLKTEGKKNGDNLSIKGKKKLIIIKKNHKNNNSLNIMSNNTHHKNSGYVNKINPKLVYSNLTQRSRNNNMIGNTGTYNDKKINTNSLSSNIGSLKSSLNYQNNNQI